MITKKDFVKTLKSIETKMNFESDIYAVCNKYNEEYISFVPTMVDEAINALDWCFENNEDYWVAYWVFDMNFGKNLAADSVIINDKPVDITTAEKLYDFLVGR